MPERGLRQHIRQAIQKAYPEALILQFPANQWTGPGWPDLLVWVQPKLFAFEVKQRGEQPTPIQRNRIESLRRKGVWACVVHNPDEALYHLRTLLEETREPDIQP